ncbi:MAG: hypothetical protein HC886_17575 [Leptolyngbyaceae cyanobacterium SM1_1_3]|nr:hypothetical protein [Leptolyngbyaceae cyanobacterium SM1_1_3]
MVWHVWPVAIAGNRPTSPTKNLGRQLVEEIETYAQYQGVKTLFLLTTTASDYFQKLGYHRCDRQQVPAEIANTSEFQHLCPDSAACLVKSLD